MKHLHPIVAGLAAAFLSVPIGLAAETSTARQTSNEPSRQIAEHTPLHLAALRGDAAAVEALLATGADPNARNQFGATALHYGIGSERIVTALLAHGAQPNLISKAGSTPLFGAVSRMDSLGVTRRLIEAGADVNLSPEGVGERALSVLPLAILGGDRRTIALLLDPKTKLDPKHLGPGLFAAALAGDLETARALLERGADPSATAPTMGTALNTALRGGHRAVAELLIERGANLTAKSIRGYGTAPLLFSAYTDDCDPAMAKLLLERGVDIDTTNDLGETVLSFALKNGPDTELVRFLTARGAKAPPSLERGKTIPSRDVPADATARTAMVRDRAQRAVDLLQRSSTAFLKSDFVRNQGKCISCHHQSLPAVAYGLARERGLQVDEHSIGRQLVAKSIQRKGQVARALELMVPTGGPPFAIGHDSEELNALRCGPDEITDAMSHYLIGVQATDGSWSAPIRRVPMGDSPVSATAWAVRAVQLYPPSGRRADAEASVRRAREWLGRQKPPTLNERVFQLLGLAWANETTDRLRSLADALAKEQRADGGWGQLPGLASDAWATGSALHALHKGGMAATNSTYQRGVDFLLRTQFDDGSWWVRTRSWPFQPHFDSKFPHGRDQWISAGASAWAATALLFTLDPSVPPASLPDGAQLMTAFLKSAEAGDATSTARTPSPRASLSHDAGFTRATDVAVDFARDIQPLLQRSCSDCHGGARPKAGFSVATRAALLKGGQNGEPAIVPGRAEESHLLRYVSDKVEDLEMPPLNRREKYPALTADEIARLRTWIEAGAPWPDAHSVNVR